MNSTQFTISAFGDEIADDLAEQLRVMRELEIFHLEFRGAWGKNVLRLNDEEVTAVRQLCHEHGVTISCIGSPIGKSPLTDPITHEKACLTRIFQIAEQLGTSNVRIFSFYPPNNDFDQHLPEVIVRLQQLTRIAEQAGLTLLHENEKGIVGDTPQRCAAILQAVDNPHLRFCWDSANFIQVGVTEPVQHWPLLAPYTTHVHIKDAHLTDGSVCAAGEGDGQIPELLVALREMPYKGYLALEPHLVTAGHSGGFSGPEGMAYAVKALRQLLNNDES